MHLRLPDCLVIPLHLERGREPASSAVATQLDFLSENMLLCGRRGAEDPALREQSPFGAGF